MNRLASCSSEQGLNWTLAQVQAFLPMAHIQAAIPWSAIKRICTDSREVQPGDCFVALRGVRFNGHDHIGEAVQAGAIAVMVERGATTQAIPPTVTVIAVEHTRTALGQLAAAWRLRWGKTLLAVTGSNGKTTVTQMCASVLRAQWGDQALATEGNLNNEIGVPLTLLRLRGHHEVAVLELGMNHPGEIAQLAAWAQPNAVLVNNAQREHQEFMKTVEAVAIENACAFDHMRDVGTAVFPADDAFTPLWRDRAGSHKVCTFGVAGDVALTHCQWVDPHWRLTLATPKGEVVVPLHMAGAHNVHNAQAAVALCLTAEVELKHLVQGLTAFRAVRGRSELLSLNWQGREIPILNDTYNANPDSVRAAMDTLAQWPGPRLMVLGDMGEVGDQGPAFHREVGLHARACGIEQLFTLGEQSRYASEAQGQGRHFESMEVLQQAVTEQMPHVNALVVKGSRFMRMERVVTHLQSQAPQKEASCC